MSRLPRAWVVLAFAFLPRSAEAQSATAWERFVGALDNTTTFPLGSPQAQEKGWWAGAWDGVKRVWNEGSDDLYLSGRYIHTAYGFSAEERARYEDWALGLGYGRTHTDERDNQRILYGMVVRDSFGKPMYLAGYGWLARWRLADDWRVGAGYSIVVISNGHATGYIPFPAPAPFVSIGTDKASIYGTYFNEIFYVFGKLSF